MPKLKIQIPKYRLHKASGQAVVTLSGKDFYLGEHGSEASQVEYNRLLAEWQLNGRGALSKNSEEELRVDELILAYMVHVKSYYVKNGKPTTSQQHIRDTLKPLHYLYGKTLVGDFGPLALKTCRERLISEQRLCRTSINKAIGIIKRMFKWGVENELVSPVVYQSLQAVSGLRKGRSPARENKPVKPVPESHIEEIRLFVSQQVWAMVQLQLLTGMRPGEVVILRSCDIDTQGKLWTYIPESHKTEHHGHARVIYLGPQAQEILRPLLKPEIKSYLFSPSDAETQRREEQHSQRKTSLSCGNKPGSNRTKNPKRKPQDHYTVNSYRRAIARACDRAFPPPEHLAKHSGETEKAWQTRLTDEEKQELREWQKQHKWHPHQLRHNAATRLRKEFGIEAARIILGHQTPAVTEIYAERDLGIAADIMARVG